jgi:hypothetical protein
MKFLVLIAVVVAVCVHAAAAAKSTAARMTVVSYADAFCKTNVTSKQSFIPGKCYGESLPLGVTGSYTAACAPNPLSGKCVTINAFGTDFTCANTSIVRPESFPCGTCLSFAPLLNEVFENCDGGSPVYKSGCDPTCTVCALTTTFARGQCNYLRTLSAHPILGTYFSLGSVQPCSTIMTFNNYVGTGCDGITAYVQPVPVGICVNGTVATCTGV